MTTDVSCVMYSGAALLGPVFPVLQSRNDIISKTFVAIAACYDSMYLRQTACGQHAQQPRGKQATKIHSAPRFMKYMSVFLLNFFRMLLGALHGPSSASGNKCHTIKYTMYHISLRVEWEKGTGHVEQDFAYACVRPRCSNH